MQTEQKTNVFRALMMGSENPEREAAEYHVKEIENVKKVSYFMVATISILLMAAVMMLAQRITELSKENSLLKLKVIKYEQTK
jgi:hypothetical protein